MLLLDVLPDSPAAYVADCRATESEVHCNDIQFIAIGTAKANRADILFGYFSRVVFFSAPWDASPITSLSHHVGNVVLLCPSEQVNRIDTEAIVAAMADEQSVWNRPDECLVGQTVRHFNTTTADVQTSVATGCAALPLDAAGRHLLGADNETINESPRIEVRWIVSMGKIARPGAELAILATRKDLAAFETGTDNAC